MKRHEFKRIAIVTPYYYPLYGGVQEYVYHLKKEYKDLGYYVKVITGTFTNQKNKFARDEHDVIRIGAGVAFPANGSTGRIILIRRGEKVRQALLDQKFDIIHYQEPFVPFLSHDVMKYSKSLNIATFHANFDTNIFYQLSRNFLYPLWKSLHGKIAVSPSAKSSITKYFPDPEIEIIPNGVSTSRFSPKGEKIEKFNDSKINILFTGRIEKRKGLEYLIKAYAMIRKNYDNVRLIVVGRGPLGKNLMEYVKKEHIPDVFFEGFVSIDELPKYYRTANIYCSPALFGESFGIVLLEAMASGIPAVAFNISGYNDVIANLEDGLLAIPRDVHDLYEKLELLIRHPLLINELGTKGRAKADKHTWEGIAQKNLEFYRHNWEKYGFASKKGDK
jgi:phosphatidylinositol alpha-mannosyltransferase